MRNFKIGDKIIYRKKFIAGAGYHRIVDKHWIVSWVSQEAGKINVVTRTGKKESLDADDPNILKLCPIGRFIFRKHFIFEETIYEVNE